MTTVFASKAEVGQQYITGGGWPITILQQGVKWFNRPAVEVRNDFTGDKVMIWGHQLLRPYDAKLITKEAITMAKTKSEGKKESKGMRGGNRGARKESGQIILFRQIGGVEYEVLYHSGILTMKGKDYTSLKEVASAIAGKEISGSGRSFFGLRTPGNIELGKEVLKGLAETVKSEKAKAEKPKKVRKVKAKKAQDDDEDDVAQAPKHETAAISAKGRK